MSKLGGREIEAMRCCLNCMLYVPYYTYIMFTIVRAINKVYKENKHVTHWLKQSIDVRIGKLLTSVTAEKQHHFLVHAVCSLSENNLSQIMWND